MPKRIVTQQQAAKAVGVGDRTIRNWISEGLITGYRLPTGRAIRVDLDEIEAMIKVIPTVKAGKQPFGPKAKIVTVGMAEPVSQDTGVNETTQAEEAVR
jgi:excisionase family DNA binding protein